MGKNQTFQITGGPHAQPQPLHQVHFIANQQKFYGNFSPDFTGATEKRPGTANYPGSSKKRDNSKGKVAAQVYGGAVNAIKSSSAGFNHLKYPSAPQDNELPPPKKGLKTGGRNYGRDKEQLQEEAIKLKITANSVREENLKLKTKLKILENELTRKDRQMEEFFQIQA